jgi:hypothetical protein
MSRKTVSAVIGSLLVAGFAFGALQGCGSSSPSAGSVMSLCMQGCAKESSLCGADAGETMADCIQGCVTSETTSTGGACSNQSAILQAGNACLSKTTCETLQACVLTTVPPCAGGTGGTSGATGGTSGATGGTSGATGGTSGATGGTSGGAAGSSGTAGDCSVCTKAAACCLALGEPATTCNMISAASCNAASGTDQTTIIQGCQEILTGGASLNAACK